jgi:hypothetical protein
VSPREELLDELDHLATVEHALCVEYLFLDCALVDRGPAFNLALGRCSSSGGSTTCW